jgi:hypothetical protein
VQETKCESALTGLWLQAAVDTYIVEMASVLDLLLRWSVLRFVEEKLQSVVKVQAFLTLLLERLALRAYQATDNEANVFLPCLCDKAGHNQERVRAGFAQLLSLFRAIYNPHRFVVFLLEVRESNQLTLTVLVHHRAVTFCLS